MNRNIKKVAVVGSGVMGSRIACHFANIGVETLLLDIAPKELLPEEAAKGLSLDHRLVKNRIVQTAFDQTLKSNPAALYSKQYAQRVTLGNFTDDFPKISECDWIMEAVVENLEIKQQVFAEIEKHRKPGTIVSSNTSGIPIAWMSKGRSEDFQKHFCGTHFFNPPRYLKLLEIIPGPATDSEVVAFLNHYGHTFLGKTTVLCKDTPAFIANRVGIYAIMEILHTSESLGLTVEEVDRLTGPVLGRPKSATFRTGDVVGLDTLVKVANHLYASLPNDEGREMFKLPAYLEKMIELKWLGDKTGQGFYKKIKGAQGSEILALRFSSMSYEPQQKVKFAALEQTKTIEDSTLKLKMLFAASDKAGEFYRKTLSGLFSYVSMRIPEIADDLYRIDEAMCTGFGWEQGPFELWQQLGIQKGIEEIEKQGKPVAEWVKTFVSAGNKAFYTFENGRKLCYDPASASYKIIPGTENLIILQSLKESTSKIWSNAGASIYDIGDGILNLEFHSKMNTMGGEVIQGIQTAIDLAEKSYRGLVIANEGANFSAGANLAILLMHAIEQEYDEIDMMIRTFQNTMMRARYSSVPVVVAPHQMALGGGCELTLHADRVVASAETYIGLVEFGVGLIPAGGGSKEFALRASDAYEDGDIELNTLKNLYMHIAMAKVSTSAQEAFEMGIFRRGDEIVMAKDLQIQRAKASALRLADAGYSKPVHRKDIRVLGKSGLAMFQTGASSMLRGRYISEHDAKISQKLAWVMSGGDLSYPQLVSEQYLLDLEREAFLSLCGEKKTLERIQSILTTGKPLRN